MKTHNWVSIKLAFTLAEVLITLGIIGLVAAMTIPTLLNATQDLQFKVAWKKEFSVLSQATELMKKDNGGDLIGLFTDVNAMRDNYMNYLKVIKYCNYDAARNCFPTQIKWLNDSSDTVAVPAGFILNDGTAVGLAAWVSANCTNTAYGHNPTGGWGGAPTQSCGSIFIDVNGSKPPNKVSKDIFQAVVLKNKLVPMSDTIYPGVDCFTTLATDCGYGYSQEYLYK